MALLKPPGKEMRMSQTNSTPLDHTLVCIQLTTSIGSNQKKWHQDNGYFRLTPTKVMVSLVLTVVASIDFSLHSRECGLLWIQPTVLMDGEFLVIDPLSLQELNVLGKDH